MRIPRFFYPDTIPVDQEFALAPEAAHHASTVLRLKANQRIVLFNGDGYVGEKNGPAGWTKDGALVYLVV